MKLISRLRDRCYCAFCKSERRIYVKKHVDLTNVLGASLLSVTLSVAYYGQPDPRALMIFCLIIGLSEIFVYMRWRTAIVCRMCGFDPVIYKKSPLQASRQVREFFNAKVDDPSFQLSRSPLLELQKKQRVNERRQHRHRALEAKMLTKSPSSHS